MVPEHSAGRPPRGAVVLALGVLLLPAAGCGTWKQMRFFSASVEHWQADLSGDIQFDVTGVPGSEIDLIDTLGVEEHASTLIYRGQLGRGAWQLDGKYFELDYEGFNTLSQEITFSGNTFVVDSDVASEIDLRVASGVLKVCLVDSPYLALGPVVGVEYAKLDASIASVAPFALSISDELEAVVPVVGGALVARLPLRSGLELFVEGDAAGLMGSYDELDGTFLDLGGRGGLRIGSWLSVGAGYRYYEADFETDGEEDASVELRGPFFFGEILF